MIDVLKKYEKVSKRTYKIYDRDDIQSYLLKDDKDNLLLKSYFKDSYKKWFQLGSPKIDRNGNFEKLTKHHFEEKDKDYFKKYFEGQPVPNLLVCNKISYICSSDLAGFIRI